MGLGREGSGLGREGMGGFYGGITHARSVVDRANLVKAATKQKDGQTGSLSVLPIYQNMRHASF